MTTTQETEHQQIVRIINEKLKVQHQAFGGLKFVYVDQVVAEIVAVRDQIVRAPLALAAVTDDLIAVGVAGIQRRDAEGWADEDEEQINLELAKAVLGAALGNLRTKVLAAIEGEQGEDEGLYGASMNAQVRDCRRAVERVFDATLLRPEERDAPQDPRWTLGNGKPWTRDDSTTFDVLGLVGEIELEIPTRPEHAGTIFERLNAGRNVRRLTVEDIAAWTDDQVRDAELWAGAIHLNASDNDDVEIPLTPAHLLPWLERKAL